MKKRYLQIGCHVLAVIVLFFSFNFSLFLGLQVNPQYGNLGILMSFALLMLYILYHKRLSVFQ